MARGRGITDNMLTKWVHAIPRCIPICDALEAFAGIHCYTSDQHVDLRASSTARDAKDFQTFFHWLDIDSPFSYTDKDRLICIASGVVAGKNVDADQAFDVGTKAATTITGETYVDMKLKRKDRVTSISADINKTTVRGVDVDINSTLFFMRVTCVINESSEMERYLLHEFAKQPPSLFDKGIMRKNAKSVLGKVLKSKVNCQNHLPAGAHIVIDGRNLLQSVPWPTDATYKQVCDQYTSHVVEHYGQETTVVFDGYQSNTSTKSAEQQRRAQQNTSSDIVFELEMKTTTSKKSFLGNSKNKDRLIQKLTEKLENAGLKVKQSTADADWLIASTAMDIAHAECCPVVVVGTDTDLLVMMVAQASPDMDLHMQFGRNPLEVYSIDEIQEATQGIRHQLLFVHAITGCDTVSAIYNQGKKKAIALLESGVWDCLDVFKYTDSSHDGIAQVGERFLLKLYGAIGSKTLDMLRHVMYFRSIRKSPVSSSGFKLEKLPPTSAAAKFHSYRAYHAVQQWQGNDLPPTQWGWQHREGLLVPIETDRPVAPEKVLKMISYGCKVGCGKSCSCCKAGLVCTVLCTSCSGLNCNNSPSIDLDTDNV